MHDQRELRAELQQDTRDRLAERGGRDAQELSTDAGGVRERAEDVEDRSDAELAPDRRSVPHRRVVARGEHESKSDLFEARRDAGRAEVDRDPELLEDVGAAAGARGRTVAVLRDARAGCDGDDRRDGRDVERVRTVAPGAAGVDRVRRGVHLDRGVTERRGEARDLLHGLAAQVHHGEETAELGRRGFAGHDMAHGGTGVVTGERVPAGNGDERFLQVQRRTSRNT